LRAVVAGCRRRVADRKADMLRRWVGRASDDRLESVMRGPLRRVLLRQVFTTMCQRFDGERGRRVEAIVEFRVGRPGRQLVDRRQIVMARGRCRRPTHRADAPSVTLEMDSVSFKVRGDLLLAARLPGLLNIPRGPDEPT
jgi:hypothetical protein